MKIKVILAHDHALFRAGLRSLPQAAEDFDVIGETGNGRDVLALAREREPDLVIMDVAMPDMNGVDATRKLARLLPGVRVLALSSHADGSFVRGMLEAGARGFLVRKATVDESKSALETVVRGRVCVSPKVDEADVGTRLPRGDGPAPRRARPPNRCRGGSDRRRTR